MFAALRALRHRRFAFLWAGQTLSRIGDFVYEIVIAWWVLKETGSAAVMSTVLIVTFLPIAVFTLVGGVVVDRVFPLSDAEGAHRYIESRKAFGRVLLSTEG